MSTQAVVSNFFVAGGTLRPGAPCYVERPADDELFRLASAGEFCYVLTPRQMGKSSLMIRTAQRLRRDGVRTAVIDLSPLGTQTTREQWYLGILKRLARDLRLSVKPESWWEARGSLGPVQRFTDFISEVILAEREERMVVFIDEIDSTLKLGFTDDFFAAIRVMYNRRANEPAYDRLTFVLLGVASPSDLIKDRSRTPFNIGRPIDLQEFSRQDAWPLQEGLEASCPDQGSRILDRVFHWTNGHPYLTQKLCLEIVERPGNGNGWPDERIDSLVRKQFLDREARNEDNLRFVHSSVEASPYRRQLLQLYRRVYQGETVPDDEHSVPQNRLRLIGLLAARDGVLQVRNQIYRRVFNPVWIRENMPTNWTRIVTVSAIVLAVLIVVFSVLYDQWQEDQRLADLFAEEFERAETPKWQVYYLSQLCGIDEQERAQTLFLQRDSDQQLSMFEELDAKAAGENLAVVVDCLYPSVVERAGGAVHQRDLSQAICCALFRWDDERGVSFSQEQGIQCDCPQESEAIYE